MKLSRINFHEIPAKKKKKKSLKMTNFHKSLVDFIKYKY